jgi:hypothetical protein
MGYCRFMGFSIKIPVNQVGIPKRSWDIWGYGLPEVWYKGGSTVMTLWWHARQISALPASHHSCNGTLGFFTVTIFSYFLAPF